MTDLTDSEESNSFLWEDLVSHIQGIEYQMIEAIKYLRRRWKNDKTTHNQLKSHPLTILEPFGNPITQHCMDHELISLALKRFKNKYVPKYLHQWIRFGQLIENHLIPLRKLQLYVTVAKHDNKCPIITYGRVKLWITDQRNTISYKLMLRVRLTDNVENIEKQLRSLRKFPNMELKACFIESEQTELNDKSWNEGIILKSEDTIISNKLYQDNCIIVAKIDMVQIDPKDFDHTYRIYVRTLSEQTIVLEEIHYAMTVQNVMEMIEDKARIPVDQQRLVFSGTQLESSQMLRDYKIPNEGTIHLVLRLRGGMYNYTSGRNNFELLFFYEQTTIKSIFAFQFKGIKQPYHSTIAEMQDSILKAQELFPAMQDWSTYLGSYSHWANSLLPIVKDSEDESDDDNSNNP